jgi:hypothetical protein
MIVGPPHKELARALADRKANADSEALLSDLIEVWGGTRQLALDVHNEFRPVSSIGTENRRKESARANLSGFLRATPCPPVLATT